MDTTEPAWLTKKVDERIALIRLEMVAAAQTYEAPFIMTYLNEPMEPTDERVCDNCGRYCPEGEDYWVGHAIRFVDNRQVMVVFGMCQTCRDVAQ
jgi:ferredoxin